MHLTCACINCSLTETIEPLENWPATCGRTSALTKLVRTTGKPKLVTELDRMLERELRDSAGPAVVTPSPSSRGCGSSVQHVPRGTTADDFCDELRLQAHAKVFSHMIDRFHSYRPILSRIKIEYERTISALRKQIQVLAPYKAKASTFEQEHRVLMAQQSEKTQAETEEKNNMISQLRSQINQLELQVLQLQTELVRFIRSYATLLH